MPHLARRDHNNLFDSSTSKFRLYWVKDHSDIMREFASNCNSYDSCILTAWLTTSFTSDSGTISVPQQFLLADKVNELENSMKLLAASIISATTETPAVQRVQIHENGYTRYHYLNSDKFFQNSRFFLKRCSITTTRRNLVDSPPSCSDLYHNKTAWSSSSTTMYGHRLLQRR